METIEIQRKELNGAEPLCYGYKAVKWDSGTKQRFRYGETGEKLEGKIFRVDGDINACSWGLHFSKDPANVFNFYEPLGYNRYFKVAAYENIVDTPDGLKTVAQCIEFVEEYDLMQFINLIKQFDRSSTAVRNSDAVRGSIAVSGSAAVSNSIAVSGSTAVSDSTAVSHSIAVSDSIAASDSTAVSDSIAVSDSTAVSDSAAVSDSTAVSYSTAVSDSNAVNGSTAVSGSAAVSYSAEVNSSTAVSDRDAVRGSTAVSDSTAVNSSYGIRNCRGVFRSLFCSNKDGISHYIFNKKSSKYRVEEVLCKIREFNWIPEFSNWYGIKGNKEWWAFCFPQLQYVDNDIAWSKMPPNMLDYIKALPEFNEAVWKELTKK